MGGEYSPDDDELLADIRGVADTLGHTPSIIEYHDNGEYGYSIAIRRYGGWLDALRAADLNPRDEQIQSAAAQP